jgi:hypothetical protein
MNVTFVSFIKFLFCEDKAMIGKEQDWQTLEEMFLQDRQFIEAVNVFLREIEFMVNENIDFNNDAPKIQALFKKFEDFEMDLVYRNRLSQKLIDAKESILKASRNHINEKSTENIIK